MTMYKKYRIESGLSQKEMAEKLKISLNAYRNYETAKRIMPYVPLSIFLDLRNEGNDKELAKILREVKYEN